MPNKLTKFKYIPDDIIIIIKEFIFGVTIAHNPHILSYPDYHPITTDPESRRALENIKLRYSRSERIGRKSVLKISKLLCKICKKLNKLYSGEV